MQLKQLDETFGILKLRPPQEFPKWLTSAGVFFVAQTSDEYSIICPQEVIPPGIDYSADYACLRADGDLAFEEVGVVAKLSRPLANAGLSLFLVSTHDRDYIFIHKNDLQQAIQLYQKEGFTLSE